MLYLLILTLLVILIINYEFLSNKRYKSIWYKLVCVIFILVAGLRYKIGGDTASAYMDWYRIWPDLSQVSQSSIIKNDTYGFRILWIYFFSFCKSISNSFYVFQLIHSVIINIIIFWFVKKQTKYIFSSILFYFILSYFDYNTEAIRETLSIVCLLLGFEFVKNKNYFQFLLISILGVGFHESAIFLFLFPFINLLKWNKISFFIFVTIFISLGILNSILPQYFQFVFDENILRKISNYYKESNLDGNVNFYIKFVIKDLLIPFIGLIYCNKYFKNDFVFTGCIFAFIILSSFSTLNGGITYRFANYLIPFYWITLSSTLNIVYKNYLAKTKMHLLYIIIFISSIIFVYQSFQLGMNPDTGQHYYSRYYPYKSIFDELF